MADLSKLTTGDREHAKFDLDSNNKVAVRTLTEIAGALQGSFSLSGLNIGIKITNTTIGNTATILPTTPLAQRNSMIFYNMSTDSIYFGNADVTTTGVTQGWEIPSGSYFSFDITDSINIYFISTGTSSQIKILEMA